MENKELVLKLLQANVNEMTEKKNGLTYLSWASAWGEILKVDADANYQVKMFTQADGTLLPYCGNDKTGYMVFTTLTINGLTRECYLPVMDNRNKSMIDNMTSFDVNKTIQRCLAKNIAMFGLGLYIYQGEDLPEDLTEKEYATKEQLEEINSLNVNVINVLKRFNIKALRELTKEQAQFVIDAKKGQANA